MEATTNIIRKLAIIFSIALTTQTIFAQYCDSITPQFNVDLSASPQMNWTSPSIQRDGHCCGVVDPDVCIEFILTLHPSAAAVNFNIASGAVPPGALFYQIDCGPQIPVGEPICLDGSGPHHLTFCKPGNNQNSFEIISLSDPLFGPDITLNAGCQDYIYAQFYDETTVNWTSIYPGTTGTYDNLLSCTSGCDTTYVTAPTSGAPAYVDYLVCGMDANGCHPAPICDTIRVYFVEPVDVSVSPTAAHLCYGDPNILVTSAVTGGTGPYNYSWSFGGGSPNAYVGAGTHVLNVTDQSGCLVATDSIVVTQDALPIVANAGLDQTVCQQSVGSLNLNGTIQTATGGLWFGGNGTYSPSTTSLNLTYTPTAAEIAAESVTLYLASTGNNGCPADTDAVTLNFEPFNESINVSTLDVSCNGGSNGVISVSTSGPFNPCQFSLNGSPLSPTSYFTGLTAGHYTIQVVNAMGCDSIINVVINQPALLNVSILESIDVKCNGDNDGLAIASANGGTAPYYYSWNSSPIQIGDTATGLYAGNYTVTVTDFNGCQTQTNVVINEPTPITINFTTVVPNCYGADNGAISSFIAGGQAPYEYEWSTGATSSNLYDVTAGTYTLTITDFNECQYTDSVIVIEPEELVATISDAQVICPETYTDIEIIANGGTGTYLYNWSPAAPNSPTISVSPVDDTDYSCIVTDNNGCATTVNTSVTVNYLNPEDLQASISSTSICENESVTLNATYIGSDATLTMNWLHCACDPSVPVNETPTTSMTYILEGVNYCNDTIYDTVYVTLNPLPIIDLNPIMGEVCPGETVTFVNLGDNDPSWTYNWYFGDGTFGSGMPAYHQYDYASIYEIDLTITDNNGCTSTLDGGSQVIVNSQAIADFVPSTTSVSLLNPTIDFMNSSINATSFIWYFGDGNFTTDVNPSHMYLEHGDYPVVLYANNIYGCPDSTIYIVHITPASELFVPNAFTPDGDTYNEVFNPKGFGISDEDYQFIIFNRWGDIIFESHDPNIGWDGEHNGLRKSQDGVYTWVVYYKDVADHKYKKEGHVTVLR